MKIYKDYEKIPIGSSDYAALLMLGCKPDKGAVPEMLNFGEDGMYQAYLVDDDAIIGEHYKLVAEYQSWLKIYDDCELMFDKRGNFKIYRAGDFGCIIQQNK